ncbi:MAG: UDP-N-acetylmuramate--L-alanine ligase [Candidatus Levybacteria bacterium]|nr:UDP-N-acetylmuramate--L-alanine ligase [Candidatus Levybacteria bacterium]
MTKKKQIYFVGIKGTNMTPLALIAKEAGYDVTGSDIDQEFITDAALKGAKIVVHPSFAPEHIQEPDFVITTGAHGGYDNIEVQTAKLKKIPVMSAGEATGLFMKGEVLDRKFTGVSIAGTHGKTTTTAMVATILKENGLDPSYIIGTGDVKSLGAPGYLGLGRYFIAEADEYATEPVHDKRARFLWQHPTLTVFTNIEHDHTDIYPTIDDVRETFLTFANQISAKGLLIACGDDPEVRKLLKEYERKAVTYGLGTTNDYILERVNISGDQTFFWVKSQGVPLGEFAIRVVGEHNALNALAALIVSLELGLSIDKIRKGLLAFQGSKRRLEFIGDLRTGAKVYDDYAHHPTEIKKTLGALRKQYPKKKIVCIFQPHTYSRTKQLFNDFLRVFESVDTVVLTDIYASLREKPDASVTAKHLAVALSSHHKEVLYLPTLLDVVEYINQNRFRSDTILVSMGAGDIYTIHTKLSFQ